MKEGRPFENAFLCFSIKELGTVKEQRTRNKEKELTLVQHKIKGRIKVCQPEFHVPFFSNIMSSSFIAAIHTCKFIASLKSIGSASATLHLLYISVLKHNKGCQKLSNG